MVCRFCSQIFCNCQNLITRTISNGRFCNQLIRNIATSFVAQQTNLYVEYINYENIQRLGIPLYIGSKVYGQILQLTDHNYFEVLNHRPLVNLNPNDSFFQTREISQKIYDYLHEQPIKTNIIEKNPFRGRYGTNCDCFIHVRLGDILTNGCYIDAEYYLKALQEVGDFDRLYIASDSPDHEIVKTIMDAYSGKSELVLKDEVETIQFGSTCRHVVLSHGTFSAVIGWLAYLSHVYYADFTNRKQWHGDIFSVNSEWRKIIV